MEGINLTIDSAFLFTAWGVLSSLLASYVPGFREWFASKSATFKQLAMFIGILLVAGIVVLLSATNVWVLIPLTKDGLLMLAVNIFLAVSANQGTYKMTPVATSVQEVKDRDELARIVELSADGVKQG